MISSMMGVSSSTTSSNRKIHSPEHNREAPSPLPSSKQQNSAVPKTIKVCNNIGASRVLLHLGVAALIALVSLQTTSTVFDDQVRIVTTTPTMMRDQQELLRTLGIPIMDDGDGLEGNAGGEVSRKEFHRPLVRNSTEQIIFENILQQDRRPEAKEPAEKKSLWEDSDVLPDWMKNYLSWHHNVRNELDEGNWEDYRYFIVRCVEADAVCAGAADRLKLLPVHLLLASQTKRLLFYYWTRPAPLEEYLVPPEGGLDWRMPAWLAQKVEVHSAGPLWRMERGSHQEKFQEWYHRPEQVILTRPTGSNAHEYYDHFCGGNNDTKKPDLFWNVYHTVWKTVFVPSPPVQDLIDKNLGELNLTVHNYNAVHVRSLYVENKIRDHEEVKGINCAIELAGGNRSVPIYFASDSLETTRMALQYAKSQNLPVVARNMTQEPLHLDRGSKFLTKTNDWKGRPASDFFDTFVDLYLLAGSKCQSHGAGGYGVWTSLMSKSEGCRINYRFTRNCAAAARKIRASLPGVVAPERRQ